MVWCQAQGSSTQSYAREKKNYSGPGINLNLGPFSQEFHNNFPELVMLHTRGKRDNMSPCDDDVRAF
jgi:hypothetical protein